MSIDTRQLTHFVAIAEEGSYRKAAERLFTSQPVLSVSIKKLEYQLGAQVFLRTSQGVALSAAGAELLDYARRALALVDQGCRAAQDAAAGRLGSLNLGFVGTASCRFLPRILPDFVRQHPDVRLNLLESDTASILEAIRQERLDLGVIREPIESDPDIALHCVELDHLIAVVPVTSRFAQRPTVSLDELRDEAFIAFSAARVPSIHVPVLQACAASGFRPRVVQEAGRVETVLSLVACGLGISLVPGVAATFQHAGLRFIALDEIRPVPPLRLSLAYRSRTKKFATLRFAEIATAAGPADLRGR